MYQGDLFLLRPDAVGEQETVAEGCESVVSEGKLEVADGCGELDVLALEPEAVAISS